jgi:Flp pilus assembly protein TadD
MTVSIAPFVNQGNLTSFDWMRVGMPGAVADVLVRAPGVKLVDGDLGVAAGLPVASTPEAAVAQASKVGAQWVVTGAFNRTEWKLELDLMVWKIDGTFASPVLHWHDLGEFNAGAAALARGGVEVAKALGAPLLRAPEPATKDFYAFTLAGRARAQLHGVGKPADLESAEKNAVKAIFIDPKQAVAHRTLALVYRRMSKPARTRGRLAYALELSPDDPFALRMALGEAGAQKKSDDAVAIATKLLTMQPWDLEVRTRLGELLWEAGDVDGALLELQRVVTARPSHLAARRLLCMVHAARGENVELAAELEVVVALDPRDDDARLDLGAAYRALGRTADAVAVYQQIVADQPRHLQALKFLGDMAREQGDLDGAIAWYERAHKARPRDPRPYFLLGATYAQKGDRTRAIRMYTLALRFPADAPQAEANLAGLLLDEGDLGHALWYARVAARQAPSDAHVLYNLGVVSLRTNRVDDAMSALDRAGQLAPQDADIQFARGAALLRLGKVDAAEAAFRKCLELSPDFDDAQTNLDLIADLRRRATMGELDVR